eukprot:SAG11_NODE_1201_length_5538_cov_2.793896_1_plen_109_part_00
MEAKKSGAARKLRAEAGAKLAQHADELLRRELLRKPPHYPVRVVAEGRRDAIRCGLLQVGDRSCDGVGVPTRWQPPHHRTSAHRAAVQDVHQFATARGAEHVRDGLAD